MIMGKGKRDQGGKKQKNRKIGKRLLKEWKIDKNKENDKTILIMILL